jgi:AcrR family transcriptional regulator
MILQVLHSHMAVPVPATLKPRKVPRQARSAATVDAIFQATIQVLLKEGAPRLTTTRVAERAGVSVGTMYQYFPHKKALLYAVLQQHLETVAEAMEAACARYAGQPLAVISDRLVAAYLDAKTRQVATSRALYAVAGELDTADLIGGISRRVQGAIAPALASASDARFDDLDSVSFALRVVLAGTARAVLERGATSSALVILRKELPVVCRAYLCAASKPRRPH